MTMKVRIEKADATSHTAKVTLLERTGEGDDQKIVSHHLLTSPAQMVELDVWQGRSIVVEEV